MNWWFVLCFFLGFVVVVRLFKFIERLIVKRDGRREQF